MRSEDHACSRRARAPAAGMRADPITIVCCRLSQKKYSPSSTFTEKTQTNGAVTRQLEEPVVPQLARLQPSHFQRDAAANAPFNFGVVLSPRNENTEGPVSALNPSSLRLKADWKVSGAAFPQGGTRWRWGTPTHATPWLTAGCVLAPSVRPSSGLCNAEHPEPGAGAELAQVPNFHFKGNFGMYFALQLHSSVPVTARPPARDSRCRVGSFGRAFSFHAIPAALLPAACCPHLAVPGAQIAASSY